MKGTVSSMKKELGSAMALYPTPLTVIGAIVNGKPNYALAAHVGIIGHDRIIVSLAKPHYTNQGIKQTRHLTVSMVDDAMLPKADYVGCVSGNATDKSDAFAYHTGKTGAPVIDESPLTMECDVVDVYETEGFESFICRIAAVYADESILGSDGKIDYAAFKPVLFEMPTYKYLRTGDVIGDCMKQH